MVPNFTLSNSEIWHGAKFAPIGQCVTKISRFFDFQNFGILTVCRVKRINLRHSDKFHGGRSKRYGDIVIFDVFKTTAAVILDF